MMKTPIPFLHPTVSIEKLVTLADIPILLFAPDGEIEGQEMRLLLAAIDGESTIEQIAEVAGVLPEHARALFAELKNEGCISILTAAPREGPESAKDLGAIALDGRDPLQGLRPRTK